MASSSDLNEKQEFMDLLNPLAVFTDTAPGHCKNAIPPEKPKRPLSAYNLFFQSERRKLLDQLPPREGRQPRRSHGKLGFKEMATIIGRRWRQLDHHTKAPFVKEANQEKARHRAAMADYRRRVREFEQQVQETSQVEPISPDKGTEESVRDHEDECDSEIARLAARLDPDMVNLLIATFK